MGNSATAMSVSPKKKGKHNVVKYNRWGYFFLAPFAIGFILYNLVPLVMTFYNSFFENYYSLTTHIGPNFVGLANYQKLFADNRVWQYLGNTAIMWVMGFIPQIAISLLLAAWFSDTRLNLKGSRFFKTVIYLPNLIMASAFAMLFYAMFSTVGPINGILQIFKIGSKQNPIDFFGMVWGARGLIALMNFLMWFGNTTILLMAGIMGIDVSLYEAAEVDGANSWQRFTRVTLPLLKPILLFVVITSLIGGIQMFDVPQILSNGKGNPANTTMTLIMYLNMHLESKNVGMGGALSVVLFAITGVLSLIVYYISYRKKN